MSCSLSSSVLCIMQYSGVWIMNTVGRAVCLTLSNIDRLPSCWCAAEYYSSALSATSASSLAFGIIQAANSNTCLYYIGHQFFFKLGHFAYINIYWLASRFLFWWCVIGLFIRPSCSFHLQFHCMIYVCKKREGGPTRERESKKRKDLFYC